MKIWVVNSEEPIPKINGEGRLMRGGMIAENFAENNCDVTWWCSTFSHYGKKYFFNNSNVIELNDNLTLHMLHVKKAYKKNISLNRILYCRNLGVEFKKAIQFAKKPDIIYCAWPHIELAYECVKYGIENNIPVVIDIRDFWPDIFIQPFNGRIKKMAQIAVNMIYGKKTRFVMVNASKVIGVVPSCMNLAGKYGRRLTKHDHAVFLSFKRYNINDSNLHLSLKQWEKSGISKDDFIVIYFGDIGNRVDNPDIIISAAKANKNPKVKFVICGDGEALNECKECSKKLDNILYPGRMNIDEMNSLAHMASVGLLPYRNSFDFQDAVPSKFAEYLSYGLPILTTLTGISKDLVLDNSCGEFVEDEYDLNNKIEEYINNQDMLNQHRENANGLFEKSFNADNIYKNLLVELDELIKDIK